MLKWRSRGLKTTVAVSRRRHSGRRGHSTDWIGKVAVSAVPDFGQVRSPEAKSGAHKQSQRNGNGQCAPGNHQTELAGYSWPQWRKLDSETRC